MKLYTYREWFNVFDGARRHWEYQRPYLTTAHVREAALAAVGCDVEKGIDAGVKVFDGLRDAYENVPLISGS